MQFDEFVNAHIAATSKADLTPREKLVFSWVEIAYQMSGLVPSREMLCKVTGISKSHMSETLTMLEDKGLVLLDMNALPCWAKEVPFSSQNGNKVPFLGQKGNSEVPFSEQNGNFPAENDAKSSQNGNKVPKSGTSEGLLEPTATLPLFSPSLLPSKPSNNTPSIISLSQNARERELFEAEDNKDNGYEEAFEGWWSNYPRKIAKAKAKKKYLTLVKGGVDPQVILDGLMRSIRMWDSTGTNLGFIPHPTTWLNGARWEDEVQVYPSPQQIDSSPVSASPEGSFATYSDSQEDFLSVYGKRPRQSAMFIVAWERLFDGHSDVTVDVLKECATLYFDELRRTKGDLSFKKAPEHFIGDCDWREYLAKAQEAVRRKATYKRVTTNTLPRAEYRNDEPLPEGAIVLDF